MDRAPPSSDVTPPRINRRRLAYHEAGHAVLSAAINDAPHFVSIRPTHQSLGRTRRRTDAGPATMVQVHLAGYAAESLLTGRKCRQFEQGLGFAILGQMTGKLMLGLEGSDECLAVREIVAMQPDADPQIVRSEIVRYHAIARESLSAVWPLVQAMAKALLVHEELDCGGVLRVLIGDFYTPVIRIQRAYGL